MTIKEMKSLDSKTRARLERTIADTEYRLDNNDDLNDSNHKDLRLVLEAARAYLRAVNK